MRNRLAMLSASFLLISTAGMAQTPPVSPSQPPAPALLPLTGTVDIGGLFSTTDGDEAR